MNVITRRIAAATALLAAPALIALGTATSSHADTDVRYNGRSSAPGAPPGLPAPGQHPQARHPRAPPPPEQPLATPETLRARMPPHPGSQALARAKSRGRTRRNVRSDVVDGVRWITRRQPQREHRPRGAPCQRSLRSDLGSGRPNSPGPQQNQSDQGHRRFLSSGALVISRANPVGSK